MGTPHDELLKRPVRISLSSRENKLVEILTKCALTCMSFIFSKENASGVYQCKTCHYDAKMLWVAGKVKSSKNSPH